MTIYLFSSSIEAGLIYALLALGVFITFRIMKIPDLTVDGSFTTGAAVSAMMTLSGKPVLGLFAGFAAGLAAGAITALMHTKLKIAPVLAGILTMTGLYSINLVIMGNQPSVMLNNSLFNVFTPLRRFKDNYFIRLIPAFFIMAVIIILLIIFFKTTTGLSIRATGDNETMVRSSSINTDLTKFIAISLSNGFAALSGAFIAQNSNYADIKMGSGMIVTGLASLILGEVLVKGKKSIARNILAAVIGSILFQLITAYAISTTVNPSFLKLISSVIVIVAVSYPTVKEKTKSFLVQNRRRKTDA